MFGFFVGSPQSFKLHAPVAHVLFCQTNRAHASTAILRIFLRSSSARACSAHDLLTPSLGVCDPDCKKRLLCVRVHMTNFRLNFQPSSHEIKHGSADDEYSALAFALMARHRVRCRRVGAWLGRWLPWIARTRTIFEGV